MFWYDNEIDIGGKVDTRATKTTVMAAISAAMTRRKADSSGFMPGIHVFKEPQ